MLPYFSQLSEYILVMYENISEHTFVYILSVNLLHLWGLWSNLSIFSLILSFTVLYFLQLNWRNEEGLVGLSSWFSKCLDVRKKYRRTSERNPTVLRERGEVRAEKSFEGVRSKRKQQMEFNMGDREESGAAQTPSFEGGAEPRGMGWETYKEGAE